ncbi:MAG: RNA methyltransferase [Methanoculleaceae archaeon]
MPEIDIVLVSPLYEGNVGLIARAMKNFGFGRLVLVDPCPIGGEAVARAGHARDVLERAEILSIDEVFERTSIAVATTGEVSKSVNTAMRMPYYSPAELRDIIADLQGRVSILFGREDWGLSNEEVKRCGIVCTIPASPSYPILNISHAVAIVCYELAGIPRGTYPLAGPKDMECLERHIEQFLDRIDHPDFKRENTMIVLRRLLHRTALTTREASVLHGLMRRAEWHMKK